MTIPTITRDQQTVVVIDAGVWGSLPNLVYEYDFHGRDSDASTKTVHGSVVARQVLTSDPQAKLVMLKVSPDDSSEVFNTAISRALDWVIAHADRLNVAAVNLSVSDARTVTTPTVSSFSTKFAALNRMDVAVVVAAGNDGNPNGVSSFSSEKSVIGVSASDGTGAFAKFSNRHKDLTDLVALGSDVTFEGKTYSGTSASAPLVAGAISAVKDAFFEAYGREATVNETMTLLQKTGRPMNIIDQATTSQGYVELDLKAALAAVSNTGLLESFGIPELAFSTHTWSSNIDGIHGQAYRLYKAAFDRTPDLPGLGYWIHRLSTDATLPAVAAGFVGSDEFESKYGAELGNADFIDLLYRNVLDRSPDAEGFAFWLGAIDNGLSRAQLLVEFSESPENRANVLPDINQGIQYLPFVA